ncbi:MAG: thiamine pyrophosphate-binding protein [Hyphomicrobiales bacterium]|jgi:acetolactate synthase-1/2/3 large subunit|nr:thiamine pyrophosphate-binding protein [Hyphomicrobiales bacterium]|tara:strand:- start:1866 stop:3527 length:1662 start_codon:yes stop_codon:yes gene_type:complete
MNLVNKKIGGHLLADQLEINGVDTIFCVPGESYLGLLDGLYNHNQNIRLITTRHESGAANMADAYAKLTNKPGICLVSRGPGATNASNGIHTAYQDSTPLILLIGQVSRNERDREAQQEIDYKEMFKPMAKYVAEINDANRIPEFINKAFYISQSGRPGPVVLSLPEDMLIDEVTAQPVPASKIVQASPSVGDVEDFYERLKLAKKPIIIVGGNTWSQDAINKVKDFVNKNSIPVLTSYRAQDRFDNRNDSYIGHSSYAIPPETRKRIEDSDFILSLGARLGEVTTQGYTSIKIPKPEQFLVHVHPGIAEIGSVYCPDIGINSGMQEFAESLSNLPQIKNPVWKEWCAGARNEYLNFIKPTPMSGDLNLSEIIAYLNKTLGEDDIVIVGSGNNSQWVHRYYQYRNLGSQLVTTAGSMGYGVPAAIAAKLVYPKKTVVSFNGDGCFMMLGQEIINAIENELNPIFVIVNNEKLGTIRMHQEKKFPKRVMGTNIKNPDFVALAKSYGLDSKRITNTEDFYGYFEKAKNNKKATLIELIIDPNVLSPSLEIGTNIG